MFYQKAIYIAIFTLLTIHISAQKSTFIILRHAEKDTNKIGAQMMQSDPPLNDIGKNRAASLVHKFESYPIHKIYSTNYNRTISTVTPLSKALELDIQIYDPKHLNDFANHLLTLARQNQTYLIVGHSNTSPKLVNLLIEKDLYKDLDESVYDTYWIVTIRNKKAKAKMRHF